MVSTDILKDFGLTDNEAKVYMACLELGTSSVQDLAKKSGVKRTTVYTTIEGLKQKGLVSQTKKGKKTLFVAESPDSLVKLSERRHKQIKKILPELKSIYNIAGDKPKLRFFEGKEGYLAVYENILKEKPKEFLGIASYEDFFKHVDPEYEDAWTARRISLGISLRWLDFETEHVMEHAYDGKESLRELRLLPKKFPFKSTIFIYNDKVAILSGGQKEFMAIEIGHPEFYHTFKQIFEILWEVAPPLPPKKRKSK